MPFATACAHRSTQQAPGNWLVSDVERVIADFAARVTEQPE